jgi:hypothetical protein
MMYRYSICRNIIASYSSFKAVGQDCLRLLVGGLRGLWECVECQRLHNGTPTTNFRSWWYRYSRIGHVHFYVRPDKSRVAESDGFDRSTHGTSHLYYGTRWTASFLSWFIFKDVIFVKCALFVIYSIQPESHHGLVRILCYIAFMSCVNNLALTFYTFPIND